MQRVKRTLRHDSCPETCPLSAEEQRLENIKLKKEAEKRLGLFFKLFPNIQNWVHRQELNHKYVETVLGRKFHLNPYSYQKERHTRNAPIQGTAGDQLKMSLGELHKNWPKGLCEYSIVAEIHDEIIADVPQQPVAGAA